ncbi:MAG: diguanylate cyclase, partial [Chloroflexi bacterium]|nr:diguanylate cyclase [Chloroflexota bacterium]
MTEQIPPASVVPGGGTRLWRALVEPPPAIREPERRRRARLLSALLVVTLLLAVASIILTFLDPTPRLTQEALIWTMLIATMILAGAYGLSRTPYWESAAVLTIVIVLLATFTAAVVDPGIVLMLAFPILGGLMSGLFLSPRTTGLVFVITLIVMLVLPIVLPGYPLSSIVNASFFVLTVGAIMVVGATMHRQDMEQIEAQSRALAERGAHLQVAVQTARQANEKLAGWVEELEQRTADITLLSRMGEMLQTCEKPDEAHAVIGQFAPRLFPAASGAVYLIDASRNYVTAAVSWGEASAQLDECIFALSECWALRRGQIHLMQDQTSGLPCQHVEASRRIAFPSVCVPMMAQGEAQGVLHLEADEVPMPLTEARQRLAQAVAEQLSLALANLKLRETLRHQSIRDPLTGLFNRRYLEETFERELQRAARNQSTLGVIMLDIDHFKRFNDTLGHEAGDALLHELGNFLATRIRGADIACRYGGEEFALILPDSPLEMSQRRAEELREGVAALRVAFQGRPLGSIT